MKRIPKSVGAFAAKTHFSALLERVAHGEVIEITRRGEPVAELRPVSKTTSTDRAAAIKELREFSRRHKLGAGLSVRKLIEEGRR